MGWREEFEEPKRHAALAGAAHMNGSRCNLRSPFRTAENPLVVEIIDRCRTRSLLCEFADLAALFRQPGRGSFGLRP